MAPLDVLLDRVARAMESVVPGLLLTPEIGGRVWLADEESAADGSSVATGGGEWVNMLGFAISYGADDYRGFGVASAGSDGERLRDVALQLMSDVQDLVSEMTTEPWPLVLVNGRRDMAMAEASLEGDELLLWFGERSSPALRLPPVRLV